MHAYRSTDAYTSIHIHIYPWTHRELGNSSIKDKPKGTEWALTWIHCVLLSVVKQNLPHDFWSDWLVIAQCWIAYVRLSTQALWSVYEDIFVLPTHTYPSGYQRGCNIFLLNLTFEYFHIDSLFLCYKNGCLCPFFGFWDF